MDYENYSDPVHLIDTDPAVLIPWLIKHMEQGAGEPLYPGDERRIFAESIGAALVQEDNLIDDAAKQVMLRYARGTVLDALGERLDVHRLAPEPAVTVLRFGVSGTLTTNIVIPQGTKATTDGSVYFATTENAILKAGETYVDVPAECTVAGDEYNDYEAGTITILVDLIPYVASVTNIEATHGGDDGEPYTTEGDDRLRERILIAPAALSTAGPIDTYRAHALKADADIVDAAVISVVEKQTKVLPVYDHTAFIGGERVRHTTLVVIRPDGAQAVEKEDYALEFADNLLIIHLFGALAEVDEITINVEVGKEGEVKIIPLMKGGKLPTKDVLDKVLAVCGADDVRPMTDLVKVEAPEVVPFDIDLTYWTQLAVESDVIANVEGPDGAIERFKEWQCTQMGVDINPDQLTRMILAPDWADGLIGALRCQINLPLYKELEDYQVAQWSGVVKVDHHVTAR